MHEPRFSAIASRPIRRNRLSTVLRTSPIAGALFLAALPTTALGQSLTTNGPILFNPIIATQPALQQITPTRTLNTTALRTLAPSATRIAPIVGSSTNPVVQPNSVAPSLAATGLGRLVAPGAENASAVVARIGTTTRAELSNLTVDFDGDGLINFEIAPGIIEIPTDTAAGGALGGLVGQHVTMATGTADRVLDGVINLAGVNPATTFEIANGTVVLGGFQPPDLAGAVVTTIPTGPTTRDPESTGGRDPDGQTRPQDKDTGGGGPVVVDTGPVTEYCTGRGCVTLDPPKPEPGAEVDLSGIFNFTGFRRPPTPDPTQDLGTDDLVNVSIMLPLRGREREGDQFSNYGNEEIW